MFFALSKLAWFALTPSNALIGLTLIGLVGAARPGRTGRWALRMSRTGLLVLLLIGFGPGAGWLLAPLESRFARPVLTRDDAVAGVIVLGGVVRPDLSFARGELSVGESAERVIAMADLARRYPAARIVFSGGSGVLLETEHAEADAVRRYAGDLGLDPARIEVESRSRTTWENAVETRALVSRTAGERWLLVTSAWHMPRAVGAFRAAGLPVEAYPVDFLTEGSRDLWRVQPRLGSGLDRFDLAAKEWVGLLAYRLGGKSAALFPAS